MGTSIIMSYHADPNLSVLVLHPRYKLQYFKQAKWEQDWIDIATDIVHETYDNHYASRAMEEEDEEGEGEENESTVHSLH